VSEKVLPLPPSRQTLSDSVYEAVTELIMDQHIAAGARVNIDMVARQLNVSPTPVREALARLEMDGLVTKEPLRGYTVTPGVQKRPYFTGLSRSRFIMAERERFEPTVQFARST